MSCESSSSWRLPPTAKDPDAARQTVTDMARYLYGAAIDEASIAQTFNDVTGMFEGRFDYFQSMDTAYHDLEHTIRTTLCWALLLVRYMEKGGTPPLDPRDFDTGLAACMLHDVGFLKEEHDQSGSGAKFTHIHEARSCEVATIYLDRRGWPDDRIDAVQRIICCTGPNARIESIRFPTLAEKRLGQMLCTADYLGQMSDPAYLQKLPILYAEFEESDRYRGIPMEQRRFRSVEDLIEKTPDFWQKKVLPQLETACEGLYRFLAEPDANGENPYLEAVKSNLARLSESRRRAIS